MLKIKKSRKRSLVSLISLLIATGTFAGGVYLLVLIGSPALVPYISKPVEVADLPEPTIKQDRIIIPKINVNIHFGTSEADLDKGAMWRFPDRGNPETGGNFIVAAHRFQLFDSVTKTLEHSPFYNIGKMKINDRIIVDYKGKRYGYKISKIYEVKPTQTEIEAPSKEDKLTLYTCTLGGAADGRVVVIGSPIGIISNDQA